MESSKSPLLSAHKSPPQTTNSSTKTLTSPNSPNVASNRRAGILQSSSPNNSSNSTTPLFSSSSNPTSSSTSPVSQTTVLHRPTNGDSKDGKGNPQKETSSQQQSSKQANHQAYTHNVPNNTSLPGHSFLSAVSEVKNMENALLSLLGSFNSGELSAFGSGRTLETMEAIRSKQERLARLHFDLASGSDDKKDPSKQSQQQSQNNPNAQPGSSNNPQSSTTNQQQPQSASSTQTPWLSESDQNKLVAGLRELSVEIEKLHEQEQTRCNQNSCNRSEDDATPTQQDHFHQKN